MNNLFGIVLFLSVLLLIEVSNIIYLNRVKSQQPANPAPFVSILVPARDEEVNIKDCLMSVLAQDYAGFELIVLDDNSTDRTLEIANAVAQNDSRVSVLQGDPLTDGWLGKNWACHQLSQKATGEYILFVDADTRMKTGCLQTIVGSMQASKSDLLSVLPQQEVVSWGEKFIVPILHWSIMCFFPLVVAYSFRISSLSVSNGQCMCFIRKTYDRIGGHSAVRKSVVEDKDLSRLITGNGFTWRLMDGAGILDCRMYRSSREAFNGLQKNLFPFFGYNIPFFVFVWSWLIVVFWQPLVTLALASFGIAFSEGQITLAFLAIGLSLVIWGIFYLRFRLPVYMIVLYPITQIVISSVAFASIYYNLRGRASWKGRSIQR